MTQTILLHPVGLDAASWRFVRLDALAIDLPGHGTAKPLPAVTLERVADAVAARLTGPAHIVGVSLGSMVAQHLALRSPQRVASLCLVAAGPAAARDVLRARADRCEAVGMAGVLDDTLARWFTPAALAEPGHPGVAYARQRLLADDAATFAAYWRAMAEHDIRAGLPAIPAPTTVVAASMDKAVPLTAMEAMTSALPRARLEVVEGPHMLHLECAATLTAVIDCHREWASA